MEGYAKCSASEQQVVFFGHGSFPSSRWWERKVLWQTCQEQPEGQKKWSHSFKWYKEILWLLYFWFGEVLAEPSGGRPNSGNPVKDKISFGFTGDKEKLKVAIGQLCQKIDLLNEEQTSADALLAVFTSKDLEANTTKVYLNCETTQFRYIIDKIALQFTNLKLKTIEKTKTFYSKNGTLITAQNLSAGKVDNPKEKGTIDSILKQMQ